MAITSIATGGNGAHATSSASWTLAMAANLLANDWVIVVFALDNIGTSDGDGGEHDGVTGEGLTWIKLGEHRNGEGSAAAGCTVSAWLARNTTGSTIGTLDIVLALSGGSVVDKAASAWKFSAGAALALVPGSLQVNAQDASTGYGSATISGLPSVERLYFRALAKEVNASGQITPSSGFTAIAAVRSRNNADAICVRGEFLIATSTGETSNPVHAVSGDTAGLFFALSEGEPSAGGNPWNYYAQS
jgi:hypothetical protein